ncbi:hypothetical protein E8E12_009911 [Didymella heteroderae]|uniref:Uncharacterized protein n=1 Tax=Didymella heteroderae TaxID=1769908 RepID=A0A9P4WUF7_9PLEO|nr:hypothetical protein E8E12_009911 [Didymella heteroderae]
MSAIPIVICGRSPEIALKVQQDLAPEYNVVRIVLSPDQGINEIPQLLSGPNPPVAVALGGAFDDATVDSMRAAASTAGEVVWLRVDKDRMSEMPSMDDKEGFGAALARRIKTCLQENRVGQQGAEKGGVFLC